MRLDKLAITELVLAAMLWGFGFIATAWVLPVLEPIALIGLRMGFAFSFGLLVCVIIPGFRRSLTVEQFKLAFWPGLFLSATMLLQTWALKYTTVTKCGFITTLYVIIVPVMERVMLGRRIPKYHMVFVAIAMIGMAFICDVRDMSALNIGDLITLACAFAASLQIVWFGKIQTQIRSAFTFNVLQTFWTGIIPFMVMFTMPFNWHLTGYPLAGMLELVVGSTMIAFALQVRAQKKISPSISSLIFLLESPFAAIFSFFILKDQPTAGTLIGAAIILFALVGSVVAPTGEPPDVPTGTPTPSI